MFRVDREVFDKFAAEIVSDIEWTRGPTRDEEPLRLALWPRSSSANPPHLGEAYNDALLAAFFRRDAAKYRFVERDVLVSLAGEVGAAEDGNMDNVLSSLRRNTDAQVLLVGEMRDAGDGHRALSYKAIEVRDRAVLAATSQRRLEPASDENVLSQAVAAAAAGLRGGHPDFDALRLGGVRLGEGARQTPFGRYFEKRVADALGVAYEEEFPGVRHAGTTLKGRYWDRGKIVVVRMILADAFGTAAVWRGGILASTIPENLGESELTVSDRAPAPPADDDPIEIPDRLDPLESAPSAGVIRGVQQDLRKLGYDAGTADGILGPGTRAAIRAYQRDSGAPADGRITIELIECLNRDLVRLLEESFPEQEISRPRAEPEQEVVRKRAVILPGWRELTARSYPRGFIERPARKPLSVSPYRR